MKLQLKSAPVPMTFSSAHDPATRAFIQLNEQFYGLCAFEPIEVLRAFLKKHGDAVDLHFWHYQACRVLIGRCDLDTHSLLKDRLPRGELTRLYQTFLSGSSDSVCVTVLTESPGMLE